MSSSSGALKKEDTEAEDTSADTPEPFPIQHSDLRIHDFNLSTEYKDGIHDFHLQMGLTLNCALDGSMSFHSVSDDKVVKGSAVVGYNNPFLRILEVGGQYVLYGSGGQPSYYYHLTRPHDERLGNFIKSEKCLPYEISGITILNRTIVFTRAFDLREPDSCLYLFEPGNNVLTQIGINIGRPGAPIKGYSEAITPMGTLGSNHLYMSDPSSFRVLKWDEEKSHFEMVFAWSCSNAQVMVKDRNNLALSFHIDDKSIEWKFEAKPSCEKVRSFSRQLVELITTSMRVPDLLDIIASYVINVEYELLITPPKDSKAGGWPLIQDPLMVAGLATNPSTLFSRTLRRFTRYDAFTENYQAANRGMRLACEVLAEKEVEKSGCVTM